MDLIASYHQVYVLEQDENAVVFVLGPGVQPRYAEGQEKREDGGRKGQRAEVSFSRPDPISEGQAHQIVSGRVRPLVGHNDAVYVPDCRAQSFLATPNGAGYIGARVQTSIEEWSMAFAEINGYRMHYEVIGDDSLPALALIHGGLGGGDGSKDTISRQADRLSENFRCVFYDRRACGESDVSVDGYDIPNCALDLRELLAHLGIEKAHILGSSAGGPIATQFALEYPDATETLILINTMSYSQEDQREVRRQELRRLKERIAEVGRTAAVEQAIVDRFPQLASDDPERFARIAAENLDRIDGIAATHQAYVDIGDSLESRLDELDMPTLVVHGDADSRIPVECGRSLAAGIGKAELHIIAGAEHGLMTNEAADETRRIVLDFLDRTSSAQVQAAAN